MNTRGTVQKSMAALVAVSSLAAVSGTVGAQSAEAATSAATAASNSTTAVSRQYVAVAKSGNTERLQLVDRRTGKVLKTLATARATSFGSAFGDVDLAADGSVYAVRYGKGFYGASLVRYAGGRATTIAPYVTSVEASPNGKQLAVTVVSPDGNHDGKGTEALRILSTSGKLVRTLNTTTYPLLDNGLPAYETGGLRVEGWLNPSTLVVRTGCCSEADISLVRADVPRSQKAWVTLWGQNDVLVAGTRGSSALILRETLVEVTPNEAKSGGYDITWLNSKRPKGQVVGHLPPADIGSVAYADSVNARYRATPLFVSPKRFPYKGVGKVRMAAI